MVQDGTGWDEASSKSVQDGTERDQTVQDGTKTTELQNRGLQVRVLPGLYDDKAARLRGLVVQVELVSVPVLRTNQLSFDVVGYSVLVEVCRFIKVVELQHKLSGPAEDR